MTAVRSRRPPILSLARVATDGVRIVRRTARSEVHAPALHGHRFFVLLFVESGVGEVRFPNGGIHLGPGDLYLTVPGELHDTRGLINVEGWVLEFSAEAAGIEGAGSRAPRLGALALPILSPTPPSDGGARVVSIAVEDRARWNSRINGLAAELVDDRVGRREAIRARLQLMLIELTRNRVPDKTILAARDPLVRAVLEAIDRRYRERISLVDVAKIVGRSSAHLTTVIRKATGMTVVEWIADRRMSEARRILLETDTSVAETARAVGYGDATHFTRLFRRNHGLTPREFRGQRS